jgi:hypothetical protein
MKLKLPSFVETFIVKIALGKLGPYLQKGISFAAAAIVAYLAAKIPNSGDFINTTVVTGLLWAIIDGLVGLIPANIIKKYGEEIQSTLVKAGRPVKIDGLALSKTSEALSSVINNANKNTPKNKPIVVPQTKAKKKIKSRPVTTFMREKMR